MLWLQLLFIVLGFLLGSILFSYHVPLCLKHINTVAQSADHNPGTANAFRLAGVPVGIVCLLLDIGKGFLPVWLSMRLLGPTYPLLPAVMLAPVLGHAVTPWYPFHGGKAIAAAFGVLIGLLPFSYAVWVLVFWYLFFSLVWVIHPNERRSVVTFVLFTLCCAAGSFITRHFLYAIGCALTASVPIQRNYLDIRRAELAMQQAAFPPDNEAPEEAAQR